MTRRPPRLVALTPGDLQGPGSWSALLTAVKRAFEAGLPGLLLREPHLDERSFLELAAELSRLARGFGGRWFALHDRVHLARLVKVDAVHLGFRSLEPRVARGLLGDSVAVGFSAHASDGPEEWEGADYLTYGPLRDTPSKRGHLDPVGLEGLAAGIERAGRPVLALGGIQPEDVAGALDAGAAGVAVLSGVLSQANAGEATSRYLAALEVAP